MLRAAGQRPGVIERPTQRTLSPYSSASGLAVMAFASEDVRQTYCDLHPFEEYGRPAWPSRKRLEAAIADARRLGYVCLNGEELFRLAAPVYLRTEELGAILGLALPKGSLPPEREARDGIISEVLAAAHELGSAGGN